MGEKFGRDPTYAMHSPRPLRHMLIAVTLRLPHELSHCRQLAFSLRALQHPSPWSKVLFEAGLKRVHPTTASDVFLTVSYRLRQWKDWLRSWLMDFWFSDHVSDSSLLQDDFVAITPCHGMFWTPSIFESWWAFLILAVMISTSWIFTRLVCKEELSIPSTISCPSWAGQYKTTLHHRHQSFDWRTWFLKRLSNPTAICVDSCPCKRSKNLSSSIIIMKNHVMHVHWHVFLIQACKSFIRMRTNRRDSGMLWATRTFACMHTNACTRHLICIRASYTCVC